MKTKGADLIWFDGECLKWEEAKIPVTTHALHYGTAVFEGIRGYSTQNNLYIFRLREHMERLHRSASVYSLLMKYSIDELCDATLDLLRKSNVKESCYIRPLTFVGLHGIDLNITKNSPTHVTIIVFPFAKYFKSEGINTCISSWRRIHDTSTPPMSKAAGNYLNSILATQESKYNGYDESILLDREGNVSEAAGENIFLIRNNVVYTPHIGTSALEGITRDTAITIAKKHGYEVMERPIPRTELYFADELFLTGTAAEITAIVSVDRHSICSGREGPITKQIRETYSKIVTGQIEEYSRWLTPVW
ncbi:MAG TPA: branched-chain amino acid transaminase [Nitrososphaeraceae archaeon]|jgi:branched-chain amino acid aminotransferase